MIHYLPTIRSDQEGYAGLAELAASAKELFADSLAVDFSRCRFFEANMAAPLGAVLAWVANDFNDIELVNIPHAIKQILRKNRFLESHGHSPLNDLNQTVVPYSRFQLTDGRFFEEYLRRYLTGKGMPRMTEGLGHVFKQKLFEVFENCVSHSKSGIGLFVCGQYFPRLQRLDLTIADAGVGIRSNVRRYLGTKISSVEAIRWALEEGHSTKTGRQPGGLGLKFLKDFITLNDGKIQIASRMGFYEFHGEKEHFNKLRADLPGTVVTIEVNTADTKSYRLKSEVTPRNIF